MLEVEATQRKEITVELHDWTVKNIILDKMHEILDIPPGAYIKNGNIIVDVEIGGGSHSWFDEEIIRKASEDDMAAILIIKKMYHEL